MMEKLIRQFRPLGSPGKGCGEHAEHPILNELFLLFMTTVFSGLGARKPKHPSGHPPVIMGSNFSSTPLGGISIPLMVNYTFGGNGLGNKRFIWPGIKKILFTGYKYRLNYKGFRENRYPVLNLI